MAADSLLESSSAANRFELSDSAMPTGHRSDYSDHARCVILMDSSPCIELAGKDNSPSALEYVLRLRFH